MKWNNDQIALLVNEAKDIIPDHVIHDRDFFLSGLDKFTLAVIADEANASKEEPDFGSLLPESVANAIISGPYDIIVHYVHIMCHKKCKEFWKTCPVPYSFFHRHEIDFVEEMYNQRLISVVAPSMYKEFVDVFVLFGKITGNENYIRTLFNTVLTREPSNELPMWVKKIHTELYLEDPLHQHTFNKYMQMWHAWLQHDEARKIIKIYDFNA